MYIIYIYIYFVCMFMIVCGPLLGMSRQRFLMVSQVHFAEHCSKLHFVELCKQPLFFFDFNCFTLRPQDAWAIWKPRVNLWQVALTSSSCQQFGAASHTEYLDIWNLPTNLDSSAHRNGFWSPSESPDSSTMAGPFASGRQLETCLKKDHYPRPEETVESGTICDRCICDTSVVSKVICSSIYPGYILGAIDIFRIYLLHIHGASVVETSFICYTSTMCPWCVSKRCVRHESNSFKSLWCM
jgi:hypothetical protein